MNRYLITVTIISSGDKAGYILFGNSEEEAESAFIKFYPGLNDENIFSREINLFE